MLLLVYAVMLLMAVLVSERAQRTVLLLLGLRQRPVAQDPIRSLAALALVTIPFTDGLRLPLPGLLRTWRLPGRALLRRPLLTPAGTELAIAARFRPNGFASVAYGQAPLVAARTGDAERVTVTTRRRSLLLHSSTDVPLARWLQRRPGGVEAS